MHLLGLRLLRSRDNVPAQALDASRLEVARWPELGHFEQAGCAHAAADAHRDDAKATPTPTKLVKQAGRELGSGTAEWVPERDGTAIHVQAILRDA